MLAILFFFTRRTFFLVLLPIYLENDFVFGFFFKECQELSLEASMSLYRVSVFLI